MGHLKQQANAVLAVVVGMVLLLIGHGGLAGSLWLVVNKGDHADLPVVVILALILSAASIAVGLLTFQRGYRKL